MTEAHRLTMAISIVETGETGGPLAQGVASFSPGENRLGNG
jgi:hypothetical protein